MGDNHFICVHVTIRIGIISRSAWDKKCCQSFTSEKAPFPQSIFGLICRNFFATSLTVIQPFGKCKFLDLLTACKCKLRYLDNILRKLDIFKHRRNLTEVVRIEQVCRQRVGRIGSIFNDVDMREVKLFYSFLEKSLPERLCQIGGIDIADYSYRRCNVVSVDHTFQRAGGCYCVGNCSGSLGSVDLDVEVQVLLGDETVVHACDTRIESLAVKLDIDAVAGRLGSDPEREVTAADRARHKTGHVGLLRKVFGEREVVDGSLVIDGRECRHYILIASLHDGPGLLVVGCGHAYQVSFAHGGFFYTAIDVHLHAGASTGRPADYRRDKFLDAVVGCGEDSSPEGGMLNFEGVDTNGKWNAREYVDGIGKHTYRTSVIGNGPCARANTGLCRLYNVEVHDGVGVDVDAVVAARIGLEQGRVGVDLHAVVVLKGIFCGEGHFLAGGVTARLGVGSEFHGRVLHHGEGEIGGIRIIAASRHDIHIFIGIVIAPVHIVTVSRSRGFIRTIDSTVTGTAKEHAPVHEHGFRVLYPDFAEVGAAVEHVVFVCADSGRNHNACYA